MWGFPFPLSSSCSGYERGQVSALTIGMLWALAASLSAAPVASKRESNATVRAACTSAESWDFGEELADVPESGRAAFRRLIGEETPPADTLESALAISRQAPAFAEYWNGRYFLAIGQPGLASLIFDRLVSGEEKAVPTAIARAALQCLGTLHREPGAIGLSEAALRSLPRFLADSTPAERPFLLESAQQELRRQLSRGESPRATLALLKGDPVQETYARALIQFHDRHFEPAGVSLARLLETKPLPEALEAQRETLRVLLARSCYELGNYAAAAEQFGKVRKSANEAVDALWGLAWAQMRHGDYSRAVGTALALQSGRLRQTFAPEAMSVLSIAFNELCMFPESQRTIRLFRSEYGDSLRWLKHYRATAAWQRPALYPITAAVLKGKPVTVPVRVAGEWLRDPVFLYFQEKLNFLLRQERRAVELRNSYRTRTPPAAPEAVSLVDKQVAAFLQASAAWRGEHVRAIERALAADTLRLHRQLVRAFENAALLEAEILTGASQDLVWLNAHPEFEKQGRDDARAAREVASAASKGGFETTYGISDGNEVWLDELGNLRAELANRCASKERYLKVLGKKAERSHE